MEEGTDAEMDLADTSEGGRHWDEGKVASYIHSQAQRRIAGENLTCSTGSPVWHSLMTWRMGYEDGRKEAWEGGNIRILWLFKCCMAEIHTTL